MTGERVLLNPKLLQLYSSNIKKRDLGNEYMVERFYDILNSD